MRKFSIAAAIGCLTAAIGLAQASPVTTPPPPLTALGGNVTAVFVYASAQDSSELLDLSLATQLIFCNHAISGTCTANHPGDTKNLGALSGPLVFTLDNTTTHKIYDTKNPDGFGIYHVDIRSSYTFSGVPPLSSSLVALLGSLHNVTFVAFEDLQKNNGSDFDYNDLIFAFSNTTKEHNPGVPEPLTLSLLGAGLLGAFRLRRRK